MNRNHKKHHNADEEFELEDPSEYEKEAEEYSLDTLNAYASAVQRHTDSGNSIIQVLSQDEQREKDQKEQEERKRQIDLKATQEAQKREQEKLKKKHEKVAKEEDEVLEIMNR